MIIIMIIMITMIMMMIIMAIMIIIETFYPLHPSSPLLAVSSCVNISNHRLIIFSVTIHHLII